MSAEKNIEDNTSKEVLSDRPKTIQGDIYVQDVHKYFGVTKALNGVNFNANFGEIHAIVGGNGCGKSTLAKAMSGVLPVDKGKVSILGQTPTSPVMARNMGIATVFQEVMIAEESSVVDNLFVGSDDFWYKNLTQREKVLKAQEIMEDLVAALSRTCPRIGFVSSFDFLYISSCFVLLPTTAGEIISRRFLPFSPPGPTAA